jgi:hypothetical protein
MRRHVWQRLAGYAALVLGTALSTSIVEGASWGDRLFGELSHDFGPVARGAKVRHSFLLTNRLNEPVSILDVRASCGCTTGRASTSIIAPGGTATVDAEMDTRNFVGRKATVLYVSLVTASGRGVEVRLGVTSTILSDIVLNPGTVDFGVVARGQSPERTLSIERVGQPDWRAVRMISGCRAIDASLTETARDNQRVAYVLRVTFNPTTPPGTIRDEIRVVTNDAESSVIPVQITGMVRGDLTATPSLMDLGKVVSAGGAQGKILVRASKPFTIRSIEGEGDGFKASLDNTTSKPAHIVTLAYYPEESNTRGDLRRVFRMQTDLKGEPPVEVTATVHVDP